MNFKIKNKFSQIFFLIKKEKSGNIQTERKKNEHKNPGPEQQTHELRNAVKDWIIFCHLLSLKQRRDKSRLHTYT